MLLKTIGRRLKHNSPANALLRSVLTFSFLLLLGVVYLGPGMADSPPAKSGDPALHAFFECPDTCDPGYHCNPKAPPERACEPDILLAGSLEIVLPNPAPGPPKKWPATKNEQGCPLTSSGSYPKSTDGKCYWVPDNGILGADNKWQCKYGYKKAPVKLGREKKGKTKDYECKSTLPVIKKQ